VGALSWGVHTQRCVFGIYRDGFAGGPGDIGASHMEVVISCRWSVGGYHTCSACGRSFSLSELSLLCLAALCCCCVGATLTFAYLLDCRCCVSTPLRSRVTESIMSDEYCSTLIIQNHLHSNSMSLYFSAGCLSRTKPQSRSNFCRHSMGMGDGDQIVPETKQTICQDASELAPWLS
jgi:hypothetical protein